MAKTDNPAEMVQRHLELGRAVHLDFQRFMIEMKIGPFGHALERIQKLTHRRPSHQLMLNLKRCWQLAGLKKRGLKGSHTSRFPDHGRETRIDE